MESRFYEDQTEVVMKKVHASLSEKDRRRYAAIEAKKLPHGGISYIASLFKCSRNTIHSGINELKNQIDTTISHRIRNVGGGRKKAIETIEGLELAFLKVLENHTAGDPMNEKIIWTDLTPKEISNILIKEGFQVGEYVVKQLLKKHDYVKRSASKQESIGSSENREEQFLNIDRLRKEYKEKGNPVLSIDTKKKNF